MGDFIIDIFNDFFRKKVAYAAKIILSTPVIVIISLFGKDNYSKNAKRYYKKVLTWPKGQFE